MIIFRLLELLKSVFISPSLNVNVTNSNILEEAENQIIVAVKHEKLKTSSRASYSPRKNMMA